MTRNNMSKNKTTRRQPRQRQSPAFVVLARPRVAVQRGILPFSDAYEARLPYVENFAISCSGTTGLTTVGNTFYGNNIYDPRIQVGGHQPMQFDVLALVFARYRVHAVEVEITFSNPLYDGMYVGYRVRPNSNTVATAGQTLDYIQEMQSTAIAPLNNTGSQMRTFRFRFRVNEVLGIPSAAAMDAAYTGGTAGGFSPLVWPIIEPYALHSVSGEDSTVRCNIRLVYHTRFSDRLTVAQS